jgi:hypothetical protein
VLKILFFTDLKYINNPNKEADNLYFIQTNLKKSPDRERTSCPGQLQSGDQLEGQTENNTNAIKYHESFGL